MPRILQSDVVTSSVGKNKTRLSIHRVIEILFPRKVLELWVFEDVSEEVFGRCCELVYSGDYSDPCPVPESPQDDTLQPEDNETQCQENIKG
jgi:hypothetical protein